MLLLWLLLLIWVCVMRCLWLVLIWSLFKDKILGVHASRTLLMCSSSFCRSCALTHTVMALCVRVLKTLYLAGRLWWPSQWSYWSVWVGFLNTVVSSVLLDPGESKVSKNRMYPLLLRTSVVNYMCESMELM